MPAAHRSVAAHSTVRALYAKYNGPLYNVTKPDGTSKQIGLLSAGGFADKKAHDEFCVKLDCVISNVFDQSPQKNHLGQRHGLINASRHSITVGPDKTPVYGMWFDPGFGYHVDNTTGIATGNDPESIYAVMSGKNYNGGCCFVRAVPHSTCSWRRALPTSANFTHVHSTAAAACVCCSSLFSGLWEL